MSYQEEEQVRFRRQRSKQAIALAMQGRWREAVSINRDIIERFPNDIDAYNRLGRACMELGEYSQAKEAYSQAIELDPHNAIARKNLRRLSLLGEGLASSEGDSHKAEPQHFIEEIGKARTVNLYRLAPPETLARMVAGDGVYLKVEGHSLIAENGHGEYLGQVEPKYGRRLIKLMEGGNKYTAAVISSAEDKVTVIIREVYQHPSQVGQLSFPAKGFRSLSSSFSDRILRRELVDEEGLTEEPSSTTVGEEEAESLFEETPDIDDKVSSEE